MKNNRLNFTVNEDKCTKCGLCASECVFGAIVMNDYPVLKFAKSCIKCQHCVALCPHGAISLFDNNLEEPIPINAAKPNYEQVKNLIISRRSIRKYKNQNVDKETINALCKTALYAPTAKNLCSVHFTVIDDKNKLDIFRKKLYDKLAKDDFTGNPELKTFDVIAKMYKNTGKDIIFAGAPHIIIASANPKESCGVETDSMIALSYFEMLAVSKNIGTLWNGILKAIVTKLYPELQKELNLPESHQVGYTMVFGIPAISYKRMINRDSENIHFVK